MLAFPNKKKQKKQKNKKINCPKANLQRPRRGEWAAN